MKAKHRSRFIALVVVLALAGLGALVTRRHEQLYKVIPLPSLSWLAYPYAINDRGQIAGIDVDRAGKDYLFLWDREKGMQKLGPALRWKADINNAGQIAATMTDPNGMKQAFLWDPKTGRQMLGTLGGAESVAEAINNKGQVVGFSDSPDGQPQPFIWDNTNGMRMLSKGRWKTAGRATAINDAGQILGFVGPFGAPSTPCFWASTDPADEMAPPLMLNAPYPSPTAYPGGSAINNTGCVLGKRWNRETGAHWAYVWQEKAGIEFLFALENSAHLSTFNDAKQIAYTERHVSSLGRFFKNYFQPYTRCYLWDPKRGKIILDKQVPPELGKLVSALDINNKGCITAKLRKGNVGESVAVLLEPIPERWGE